MNRRSYSLEDALAVRGVHAELPEVRRFEIFLALIAEEVLQVPADEGRGVVAERLEAVDHGRRAREQVLDALVGRCRGGLRILAFGDVAPGTDHLGRLARRVANEPLLVDHPAIGAVLLPRTGTRRCIGLS